MDSNYYKKYEPIFGEYYIKEKIGEGSFGQVYRIERSDISGVYDSALKALSIPKNQSDINRVMLQGRDPRAYYEDIVKGIINEIGLMSKLKGHSNIVSLENHKYIQQPNGIGWDILIQMELLTPLFDHQMHNDYRVSDVIKIAKDICRGLMFCHSKDIIHRDIKPENIFYSTAGHYKIGDFGVAKISDMTEGGTRAGTESYMAPEVYNGEEYGKSADIYSLGIVMYRMLNNHRLPFEPKDDKNAYMARVEAMRRRMSGEKLEPPALAKGKLSDIILKACEFKAANRYQSAEEMLRDLEKVNIVDENKKLLFGAGDTQPNYSVSTALDKSYVQESSVTVPMGLSASGSSVQSPVSGRSVINTVNDQTLPLEGLFASKMQKKEASVVREKPKSVPPEMSAYGDETLPLNSMYDAGPVADVSAFVDDAPAPQPDSKKVEKAVIQPDNKPAEVTETVIEKIKDENKPIDPAPPVKQKTSNGKIIAIAAVAAIVVIAGVIFGLYNAGMIGTPEYKLSFNYEDENAEIAMNEYLDVSFHNVAANNAAKREIKINGRQAINESIEYFVDNEKIATVSKNGVLTGKAPGETTVVLAVNGLEVKSITVKVDPVVDKIKNVEDHTLTEGETTDLDPSIEPKACKDVEIKYSSTDEKVATVDKKGVVTAKAPGTCKIKMTAANCTKEINITVNEKIVYQAHARSSKKSGGHKKKGGGGGGGWSGW